jgi:hypothetical protein
MEVLDEQLDSVTKFLRRLDSRIELFREQYHCDDNDDEYVDCKEDCHGEDRRELEASHQEEIDRQRLETKTLLEMSALEEMRSELLLSSAAEIAHVQSQANMEHFDEFKQLCTEMEASSALALEGQARKLLLLHAVALRELRAELQASYSSNWILKIFVTIQGADLWRFDKHKKKATLWTLKIFVETQGADLWRFDKHKKKATLGMGEYPPEMNCTLFCGTQGIEVWMGKHLLPSCAVHKWSYRIVLPDLV